jgi:hypothetical protein
MLIFSLKWTVLHLLFILTTLPLNHTAQRETVELIRER